MRGELEAIEIIARTARRRNREVVKAIGDDAALYRDGLVVTTDAYLENLHFDRSYMELSAVGGRAACGTLSDIAAMCARPLGLFTSLMMPRGMTGPELRELYLGMDAVCSVYGTGIAGGDIVAAPRLGLAVTAIGRTKYARMRSGAKPGDYVYITGQVALAETGRLVLKHGLTSTRYRPAIERHICPLPRISEALLLAPAIRALIDTSDGVSTDAAHIAAESQVKVVLNYELLPVAQPTRELTAELGLDLEQFVLSSGEDYELLLTSPHPMLRIPRSALPLTRIGQVESGRGVYLVRNGRRARLRPSGYDHLRNREHGH